MGLAVATVAQIRQPGRLPRKSWCLLMWNSRVLTKNWRQKLLKAMKADLCSFCNSVWQFSRCLWLCGGKDCRGVTFPQEGNSSEGSVQPAVKALVEGLLKVFWSFHSCFLWQSSRPSEIRSKHAVGVFGLFQVVPSCSKLFQDSCCARWKHSFHGMDWHVLKCHRSVATIFGKGSQNEPGSGSSSTKLPGCLYHVWSWRCCASFLHGAALRSGADRRHFGISIDEWGITKMFFWPLALVLCDSGRDNQLRVKSPPMIVIIN